MDYLFLLKEAEDSMNDTADSETPDDAVDDTENDNNNDDIEEEPTEEEPPIEEENPISDEDVNIPEDDMSSSDEPSEDSSVDEGEETPEAKNDRRKNLSLYTDMMSMITGIKGMIMKLTDVVSSDLLITKISFQVKTNLEALLKQLYNYLFTSFKDNNYITNLYNYAMFKEALSMNISMLKKIEEVRDIKTNK